METSNVCDPRFLSLGVGPNTSFQPVFDLSPALVPFGVLFSCVILVSAPDPCYEKTCNERGKCVDGLCTCEPGYTGEECEFYSDPDSDTGDGDYDYSESLADYCTQTATSNLQHCSCTALCH